MLLSVIVPLLNAELTLTECVNSVLRDKSTDFELILVNDGSTDASARLCDAFAAQDSRVVVIHQKNQGLACARNAGIRVAKGDYVAHLDSDDFFLTGWFLMITQETRLCPDADALVWPINQLIDGVLISEEKVFREVTASCLTGLEAFEWLFCSNRGTFWHSVRYVVRCSCIREGNLYYRKGVLHEDIDFNPYLVLRLGHIHFCRDAYYIYRKGHSGSVTHHVSFVRCRDMLGIVERWMILLPETGIDPALQDAFLATLSRQFWDYLPYFNGFPPDQRNVLFDELQKHVRVLKYVKTPSRSAFVKRVLLALLGVKGAVLALVQLRRIGRLVSGEDNKGLSR